jgi:hypothetical protein
LLNIRLFGFDIMDSIINWVIGSTPVVTVPNVTVVETWMDTVTSIFNVYPTCSCVFAGLIAAIIAVTIDVCLFRVSSQPLPRSSPKQEVPEPDDESESDDDSEYVYKAGDSTLEIIEIYTKVLEKFPDIASAKLASGGLPDVAGPSTSDVDLLIVTENITGFEHSFGDHLIQIKAQSVAKPHRTVYTIRLPEYNRNINIYATNNPNNTDAITHRDNEVLLNQYQNLQQVAIWHKMFVKDADGSPITTEEAWARTLCLYGDPYDRMAQASEKIKAIADLMEPELQSAFVRI